MNARTPSLTLLALLALPACFGGSPGPKAASSIPKDPTPQAKCAIAANHAEPLVTEWPASQKARLEALLSQGAVAVEYAGCEMRVVDACQVKGDYAFRRTTLAKDQVEIGDEDELYAKLPLGAVSLSGQLARSGRLAVQTIVAGQLRLQGASASDVPADGACARATHLITAVSVGAFKLLAGGSTKVSGGAGALGVEGGGSSAREEEVVRESGDPAACEKTTDAPNASCSSPLQLFLEPLPRHAQTEAMSEREGQADAPPTPGSWRVDYKAGEEGQRWALVNDKGRLVCDLPCTRWTPPNSGFALKLDANDPDDAITWPVPAQLGFSEGRRVEIIGHEDRGGSNTAGPWLTIPFGLVALAGGAVFAVGVGANSGDPDGPTNVAIGGTALAVGLGMGGLGVYLWSRPSGLSTRISDSAMERAIEVGPGYARVTIPGAVDVTATPGGAVGTF